MFDTSGDTRNGQGESTMRDAVEPRLNEPPNALGGGESAALLEVHDETATIRC